MIFSLIQDFADALDALPRAHPRYRILKLLDEAIRRDVHFIDRHPTTFFQCMWNTCWWYDCPDLKRQIANADNGWVEFGNETTDGLLIHPFLESWRSRKQQETPGFRWLRSLRPPPTSLGTTVRLVLTGHSSSVWDLAFAPDGSRLASTSMDRSLRLWDVASGAERHCIRCDDRVKLFARPQFDETGQFLAVSGGHSVWVYSTPSGELLHKFSTGGSVHAIACSGSDIVAAMESPGGEIEVWNINRSQLLARIGDLKKNKKRASFSSDASLIAWWSEEHRVHINTVSEGLRVCTCTGHGATINSVQFSSNGQWLVTASADRTAKVWSASTGELTCQFAAHASEVVEARFLPDDLRVASLGDDKTVHLWRIEDCQEICSFPCRSGGIGGPRTCFDFGPDGRQVATVDCQKVCLWDASTGKARGTLLGHGDSVRAIAFSPDRRHIATSSDDNTIRIWSPNQDNERVVCEDRGFWQVTVSPDGKWIASANLNEGVWIWDAATHQSKHIFRGKDLRIWRLSFSPNSRYLAVTGRSIRIWEVESWSEILVISKPIPYWETAFFPEGRILATASGPVLFWDFRSGELVREIYCSGSVKCIAVSADGTLVAGGTEEGGIAIWDISAATDEAKLEWEGHAAEVENLAFSPDGSRVVSDSNDNSVRVWEVKSGLCLETSVGRTDVRAMAAGARAFPFRAIRQDADPLPPAAVGHYRERVLHSDVLQAGLETQIEERESGNVIAWYSHALRSLATHPSGTLWVGAKGSKIGMQYLTVIQLECEIEGKREQPGQS